MPRHSRIGMPTSPERGSVWAGLGVPAIALLIFAAGLAAAGALLGLQGIAPKAAPSPGTQSNRPPLFAQDRNAETGLENAPNLSAELAKMIVESGALDSVNKGAEPNLDRLKEKIGEYSSFKPEVLLAEAATVTTGDVTTIPTSDPGAIKGYFNAVYAVYAKHLVPIKEDDVAILSDVIKTQRYGRLRELDAIIAALDQSYQGVKAIPVPEAYRDFAVNELNYLLKTKRGVETLARFETDPLAASLMLVKRRALQREIKVFHLKTLLALASNRIIFTPDEGGYAYFQ